jgi:DNA-binding NarL/FixJ family response regulator
MAERAKDLYFLHSEGVGVSQIRVLLADDNSAILSEVTRVLEKDYEVVAAVKDGQAVIGECLRLKPDVVVFDISIGEVSGIELARQLRDRGCYSKVVFLSVHEDYDFVHAAMGAGGLAYVVKSHLSSDLITAMKAVSADKLFVSKSLLYEHE